MYLHTAESGTFKIEKDYTKEREEVPARSGWYIIERRENNKVIICYYDEYSDFWWNDEEFTEIKEEHNRPASKDYVEGVKSAYRNVISLAEKGCTLDEIIKEIEGIF